MSNPVSVAGSDPEPTRVWIDHIPALYVTPQRALGRLVIWIPYFTGSKEAMVPFLGQLAEAGFHALSFDPWQHGERSTEPAADLPVRVFGNFRRHMWPILGQTTLDILRVIDWATASLPVSPEVFAGGISMGGDISVTAAGADSRITTVAAVVATPDWLRPGMRDMKDLTRVLPPGEPDAYAAYFYDHLNPLTHPDSYGHRPAITFECGQGDLHVPPDGALRFQEAQRATYQDQPDRLRVTLHPGVGHKTTDAMLTNCLSWFQRWQKDQITPST